MIARWKPVLTFLFVGLLLLSAIIYVTRTMSARVAREDAIIAAETTTETLALSVAAPLVTDPLAAGEPAAAQRFRRLVGDRWQVGDVQRVKVWNEEGMVVYSSEPAQIGTFQDLDDVQKYVLRTGETYGSVNELSDAGDKDPDEAGLVEVYTLVESPGGAKLLFEAYFERETLEERAQQVIAPFERILVGGLSAMGVVAMLMLAGASRQLARSGAARERLLAAAISSAQDERRRISRDLHDGVVQDFAGSAFSVSAVANVMEEGPLRQQLTDAAADVRKGLASLRTLLVEIYPPDLTPENFTTALGDLTAHAENAQMQVSVDVGSLAGVSKSALELVWRVAQEGVRNAVRHSGASELELTLHQRDDEVGLVIADNGRGFEEIGPAGSEGGLGLQGLASLVRDADGVLTVESQPGQGTTLRLQVPR